MSCSYLLKQFQLHEILGEGDHGIVYKALLTEPTDTLAPGWYALKTLKCTSIPHAIFPSKYYNTAPVDRAQEVQLASWLNVHAPLFPYSPWTASSDNPIESNLNPSLQQIKYDWNTEGQILKLLDHPNIIKCYGIGVVLDTDDIQKQSFTGNPFLVLEYIDSKSLEVMINAKPVKYAAKKIVHQLLETVAYLNSKSVSHNGMYMDNILCSVHNGALSIKLCGFGNAAVSDNTLSQSEFWQLKNDSKITFSSSTINYLVSPFTADIQACGKVLLALLSENMLNSRLASNNTNPMGSLSLVLHYAYTMDKKGVLLANYLIDAESSTLASALNHPYFVSKNYLLSNQIDTVLESLGDFLINYILRFLYVEELYSLQFVSKRLHVQITRHLEHVTFPTSSITEWSLLSENILSNKDIILQTSPHKMEFDHLLAHFSEIEVDEGEVNLFYLTASSVHYAMNISPMMHNCNALYKKQELTLAECNIIRNFISDLHTGSFIDLECSSLGKLTLILLKHIELIKKEQVHPLRQKLILKVTELHNFMKVLHLERMCLLTYIIRAIARLHCIYSK